MSVIVVGAGRVGIALAERSAGRGAPVALVRRDEGWGALDGPPGDPVVLAVRNDDLLDVVARVPAHRRDDLVFLQNGMIRPFLKENALERNTRGILYLAVAKRGDPITPGGINPFTGPHAHALTRWFVTLGLEARELDWARFSYYELEKMIWLCATGVLCEVHGESVGEVADRRVDELRELADELRQVGRAAMGVDAPLGFLMERMLAYSARVASWRGAVKEWPWRDGWFVAAAARYRVATPRHHALLRAAGKGALLPA